MTAKSTINREIMLTCLAGIVHDLRNPLLSLKWASAAITRRRKPPAREEVDRFLTTVTGQIDCLDRMLGDLLDAVLIETGQLEIRMEIEDLRPLVKNVVDLFGLYGDSHPIELSMPDHEVLVPCDCVRMQQVLTNLLSNAVKYSESGGEICVRLTGRGATAVLSVSDFGVGISPRDLPHIFEPFRRTSHSRENTNGTGLGLSMSRRVVQAHGGQIDVTSTPGCGSTFSVRLPRYVEM